MYEKSMSDMHKEKWPEMRMKHLEMIQNVITRMASNSSNCKNYCTSITAALLAFSAAIDNHHLLLFSLPLVGVMALMDSSYLKLEQGFRNHFEITRQKEITQAPNFEIKPIFKRSLKDVFFTWSVFGFYSSIFLTLIIAYFIMGGW